jgi:hypothetical protein
MFITEKIKRLDSRTIKFLRKDDFRKHYKTRGEQVDAGGVKVV